MQYGYLLKISNKNIYREVQIPFDSKVLKIGMGKECDVRFLKESFFDEFELVLKHSGDNWNISCSDNLYIDAGDVRKLVTKKLYHGDSFVIKYQNSENEVFKVDFVYDFDNENKDYSRIIDLSSSDIITVGNNDNVSLCIKSEYVINDIIELKKSSYNLIVTIKSTTCGFYHNGKLATNGEVVENGDFFSVANFSFFYKNGFIMTSKNVKVNGLNYQDAFKNGHYPKFTRNTRLKNTICKDPIDILDPPSKPEKQKGGLIQKLLPAGMMVIMCIVMGAMSDRAPTMMIFSVMSGVMAAVTAVIGVVQGNKEYKKKSAERIEKYNNYIDEKRTFIKKARLEERSILSDSFISIEEEKNEVEQFSYTLFDRIPTDEDYLLVRVGTGNAKAMRPINYKIQEKLEIEDALQEKPLELFNEFSNIDDVPVIVDFKSPNAIGIVGNDYDRYSLMKNIVIDICARQYQTNVKLFFVVNENNVEKINWLRFLPHVQNDITGARNIVCNDESRNVVFEFLYKELTQRVTEKKFNENYIVFLYDEYGFYNHPISKFVDEATSLGVTFIFFGNNVSEIGQGCNYIIDVEGNNGSIINVNDKNSAQKFSYNSIDDNDAKAIVNILAPVYSEEISLEGTLTKNISMFKLLNILAVDDIDLSKNWTSSQVFKSMAAPIGVSKSGEISLDLHDKAHGPHGLVAGTTGSGKSEILQTYILSIATLFHPYEIGFVIIDFKGGGMVNQFKKLPHLMGAITNIDGKEIDRSLKSIKAELQKRQRYFAEADVNHIDKYIKKYKAGEVSKPLPHLIIIVDEFAELKAEQPDFMKELISAARIGRSLGVHLILATQKPSGQVDDQIWSNSRFKLCLKVQDQSDSNEVIKSPLAAEIKEPGRAYLQVGNNEIFELFQSAYSGAPEVADNSNIKEFKLFSINDTCKKSLVYEQKKPKNNSGGTQLDAIVNYVYDYTISEGISKLPDICLPPLKKQINCPELSPVNNGRYSIGIYDDPDSQYQGEVLFDLSNENTFIMGSSQTGKTNMLQLIIKQIASYTSAKQSNFYIMDFGSMILKNFDSLKHVGGVVLSSEEEKLKNMFKLLNQELDYRKEKLMNIGVSSISAYLEAGYDDIPYTYIILDNFAVFRELYAEKFEDDLLYICREGNAYGFSIIVTSNSTSGFGYKYLSNFANNISFYCNDSSEYSNLFDRCRMEPTNTPGRMLVSFNKSIFEAQSYLAYEGEKEIDRVSSIKKWISKVNDENSGLQAKRIPEVPDELSIGYIENNYNVKPKDEIAISLSYQTVEPITIGLCKTPMLSIVAKKMNSSSSFVSSILSNIKNYYFERPSEVYIFDTFKKEYKNYEGEGYVNLYTVDYSMLDGVFETVETELEERYNNTIENGIEYIDNVPYILIVINSGDAIEYISKSKKLMDAYNLFISKYKEMKFTFLFAGIEDANFGYSSPELYKKIKEQKLAFIFTDLQEHKMFDIPIAFTRQNKKPLDSTQGYFIKDSEIHKIRFTKED